LALVALGHVEPRGQFSIVEGQHAVARVDLNGNVAAKCQRFVSKRESALLGADAQRRGTGFLASES
jgi:hypothetical protein